MMLSSERKREREHKSLAGNSHGNLYLAAPFSFEKIPQEEQGFLTNRGIFVNRYQAGAIAYMAGQTKTRKEHLLSEDLW